MERAGIPTAQICAITQVAIMVGSNRIIPACSIVSPLGNPQMTKKEEKALRRAIIEKALEALKEEIQEQKLFYSPAQR
jgi:glycine reductase